MNSRSRIHATRTACGLLAVLLCSCSGGSGSDVADISGSGVVSGPVSGFGSIIANGTHMDVSHATLTNDGVTVTQADIDIGDSVVMRGTLNGDGTGSATTVITDEFLKGPVSSVDIAGNRIVAMGQTVNVDLATVFDGVTLETLLPGQNVEVHGTLDANDQVRATRVELKDAPLDKYEVTGFVDGVTPTTFTINGLIVNYSGANVNTEGDGPLAAGMYVDVEAAAPPVSGTLTATEVHEEERVPGAATPGQRAEIRGTITDANAAPSRFMLEGILVQYGSGTQFEDGTAAGLVDNAVVEVEGTFDSAGVLQASEIHFEQELNVRITTTLDAVDSGAGTLTILGKTVHTTLQTQFEDERDQIEPLGLANLAPGDYVEVRAYLDGDQLVASRVERDQTDTELVLRGPVDGDPTASPFSILGISIAATDDVGTQFQDDNDATIDAATFYTLVGPNDVVEIEQDVRTQSIVANSVEIEALVP